MKRSAYVALAAIGLVLAVVAGGCERTIEVQTGVRVECPYGHVDEKDITTVEVPANTAGAYRVRSERRVCDRHAKLEALYAEAQTAIAAGDLETARTRLAAVVADDPGFRSAQDQYDAVSQGRAPAVDTDTDTPSKPTTATPKPGEGDTSGPVGSLAKYTPDSVDGFTAEAPLTDPLSVSRQYTPTGSSKALAVVIVAEQFRTPEEAERTLRAQMDAGYSQDDGAKRIGSHRVTYGTDGQAYASAGFTDGAILVVLEVAAKRGSDPRDLLDVAFGVIEQLP